MMIAASAKATAALAERGKLKRGKKYPEGDSSNDDETKNKNAHI